MDSINGAELAFPSVEKILQTTLQSAIQPELPDRSNFLIGQAKLPKNFLIAN